MKEVKAMAFGPMRKVVNHHVQATANGKQRVILLECRDTITYPASRPVPEQAHCPHCPTRTPEQLHGLLADVGEQVPVQIISTWDRDTVHRVGMWAAHMYLKKDTDWVRVPRLPAVLAELSPRPDDFCECGDIRRDHKDGTGSCLLCLPEAHQRCRQFRFYSRAHQ
jgi:hypothetical protein